MLLPAAVARLAPACWPDGRWTCVLDADVAGDDASVRRVGDGRLELCDRAGVVLWTVGYGVAHRARVDIDTRRFLWITAAPTTARVRGGGGS